MSISNRERFLGICRFERPGDLYVHDYFWPETLRKWVKQGAPEQILNERFRADYFQLDFVPWIGDIRSGLWWAGKMTDLGHGIKVGEGGPPIIPAFEPRIVSEDERTITVINCSGQTVRYLKEDPSRMPMFLDWPVRDRATWKEYKKRLEPSAPERWPADWNTWVQEMKDKREATSSSEESYMPNQESSDWNSWVQEMKSKSKPIMFKGITFASHPVSLQVGSFYGYLREMIGSERILYMFYDDPALIEDMMDTMLHLETEVIKRVVKDIRIDQATFWEDMCYKAGPLISPTMVRKFMMPRYKKITELLRRNGVDVIFVDSDGNINQLIPLWLESGINYVWPLEVAAHNDAVALRKKYGKDLIMSGNIDKRALIKGKEAIREEIMSKVPFLLEQGGYFPTIDHWVPPDVTFESYCYYINTLREAAGLGRLSF